MRYTYESLGFSFDLPEHWKQGLAVNPAYPNTTTFDCADGKVLIIPGEIRDDLVPAEARRPVLEQDFRGEGYCDIRWSTAGERLGTESNVLVARYDVGGRKGCAISAVHNILDMEVRFEGATDEFVDREVADFMASFEFFQPSGEIRPDQLDRSSDPSPLLEVLLTQDPEEKRRILAGAGAPSGVSGPGYTMHDISHITGNREGQGEMDTAEKVREALRSWKEGDRLFDSGDFEGSVGSYTRALDLSRSLPPEEEFDHLGFEASCNAGLSGSLGRLGSHRESLAAAEAALAFFNRCGDMYPVEAGKWLMAVVNRGAALAMLGRPSEALEAFERAKKMLSDRGMDKAENRQWVAMVDQNISSIRTALRAGHTSPPWWKFWARR